MKIVDVEDEEYSKVGSEHKKLATWCKIGSTGGRL